MGDLVFGPRPGRMRDRRGRGVRGVRALPGPLSPRGIPARRTRRAEFERIVTQVVTALDPAFQAESDQVEVIVEDAPRLPVDWDGAVPSSVVSRDPENGTTRLVLFRMPISQHAVDADHLEDVIWTVLIDQLAAIWQVSPDDLDPRP